MNSTSLHRSALSLSARFVCNGICERSTDGWEKYRPRGSPVDGRRCLRL